MHRLLRAAILITSIAGSGPTTFSDQCSDCTFERQKARLCKPHRAAEKEGLAAARKAWKKAEGEQKIQLLVQVAKLTGEHEAAPSKAVAEFIARALEDPDPSVVDQAVRALLDGQHPDVVVDALVDAFSEAEGQLRRTCKALVKTKFEDLTLTPLEVTEQLLLCLGQLPDPRTERVILEFMERKPTVTPGRLYVAAAYAGLALGSEASARGVAELVDRLARAIARNKTGPHFPRPRALNLRAMLQAGFVGALPEDLDWIMTGLREAAVALGDDTLPTDPAEVKNWMDSHAHLWTRIPARLVEPIHAPVPVLPGGGGAAMIERLGRG